MNDIVRWIGKITLMMAVAVTLFPAQSQGDPGQKYCVEPPFINASIPPNVLLMIDNSGSMYDLAYVDKGQKHCSATASLSCSSDSDCKHCSVDLSSCSADSDCPSGETCVTSETCSNFDRRPYYCYDETYRSGHTYVGYFAPTTYYYYDAGADDFKPAASAFPSGCPSSAANATYTIAGTMCVEYTSAKSLVNFVALGNYLNWLTASKFDVQKQILTGGKYDGSSLLPESRGCVGKGYGKQALRSDFTNYPSTVSDPNTRLPITFLVQGPPNPYSSGAPSPGGQTYIDLFAGAYDFGSCQKAVDTLSSTTSSNDAVKRDVAACLASSTSGYCEQQTSRTCFASYPDCDPPLVAAHCSGNPSITCNPSATPTGCFTSAKICATGGASCTNDASCIVPATYWCTNNQKSCTTGNPINCSETLGYCTTKTNWACRTDDDCGPKGPCVGYVEPGTCVEHTAQADNSPCTLVEKDYGTCLPATGGTYVGPCVFQSQAAATKTKVSFQQSMQACWAYRKWVADHTKGSDISNDDANTLRNQCSDVYGGFYTCSNDHNQTCDPTATNPCGTGNLCVNGPNAIDAGNPALVCGLSYGGQLFHKNINDAWVIDTTLPTSPIPTGCASGDSVSDCMIKIHRLFCDSMFAPQVTDPTDAPSDSTTTDTLPAILIGVGIESQLGSPIKKMRVKIPVATAPTGLIQEFGSKIRLGAMSFNSYGSSTESGAGTLPTPKVCSNDSTMTCAINSDCGPGHTCDAATNLDGGQIRYPVGKGHCSTTPGTVCTTNVNCTGSGNKCVLDSVGDHTTSDTLVSILDGIRGCHLDPLR